jgi:hypothetical protein
MQSTLHGGRIGWDRRNWTIVLKSDTSVTYKYAFFTRALLRLFS